MVDGLRDVAVGQLITDHRCFCAAAELVTLRGSYDAHGLVL